MKKSLALMAMLIVLAVSFTSCTPESHTDETTIQGTGHGDSTNSGEEPPQDPPDNGED